MWVRFGRDDRAKPQDYSKYFEDFETKERSKTARRWDARTGVILSRALRGAARTPNRRARAGYAQSSPRARQSMLRLAGY